MIHATDPVAFGAKEIHERFVRSTGARGQNVTKDATAVELTVDLTRSALAPDVKARLMALAGRNINKAGVLRIVCRANRSQAQNRVAARARLSALLQRAIDAPPPRKGTTPPPATREDRLVVKHQHAAVKRARRAQAVSEDTEGAEDTE